MAREVRQCFCDVLYWFDSFLRVFCKWPDPTGSTPKSHGLTTYFLKHEDFRFSDNKDFWPFPFTESEHTALLGD